jgi:hypothetical protein
MCKNIESNNSKNEEQKNYEAGIFTIEASIVMPIVILCIIVLISISTVLNKKAVLQSFADRYTYNAAEAWNGMQPDPEVIQPLYWRIIDPDKGEKLLYIKNILIKELHCGNVYGIDNADVHISMHDYFIIKKIRIEITKNNISVSSESMIKDKTEFVRNIDFICELWNHAEEKFSGLKGFSDSIRDIFTKAENAFKSLSGDGEK